MLSDDDIRLVRKMRLTGETLRAIGDVLGITHERVRQIIESQRYDKVPQLNCVICGKRLTGKQRYFCSKAHKVSAENKRSYAKKAVSRRRKSSEYMREKRALARLDEQYRTEGKIRFALVCEMLKKSGPASRAYLHNHGIKAVDRVYRNRDIPRHTVYDLDEIRQLVEWRIQRGSLDASEHTTG